MDAGSDLITDVVGGPVSIVGFADDDAGTPTLQWSKVTGPGTVTFSSAESEVTDVTFSVAGVYTLSLSAEDDFSRVEDRVPSPCSDSM